jgi:hypothetical protein
MTYEESIRKVNIAYSVYYKVCDLGETDDVIGARLVQLQAAKKAHRDLFGSLTFICGYWH